MMWCFYCNREIDERCDLCIYKEQAEDVAEGVRSEMKGEEKNVLYDNSRNGKR